MPLVRYPGFDRGVREPAPTPGPSPEAVALRAAVAENAALSHRVDALERVLRSACHLLSPYARPTPPRR
jgi:hypothetical protein